MTQGKELVGTYWQHRTTEQTVCIKEQFRVGEDIESWLDCRDANDTSQMLRSDQLVREYTRIY